MVNRIINYYVIENVAITVATATEYDDILRTGGVSKVRMAI